MDEVMELDEQEPQTGTPAAAPAVSRKDFERKCIGQMRALLDEAKRGKLEPSFVWVATWCLAEVMSSCGRRGAADVLRKLGDRLDDIVDREVAEREAAEAKAQGRMPS